MFWEISKYPGKADIRLNIKKPLGLKISSKTSSGLMIADVGQFPISLCYCTRHDCAMTIKSYVIFLYLNPDFWFKASRNCKAGSQQWGTKVTAICKHSGGSIMDWLYQLHQVIQVLKQQSSKSQITLPCLTVVVTFTHRVTQGHTGPSRLGHLFVP